MFRATRVWHGQKIFHCSGFIIVMCAAAHFHCSAVFQVTSGATAFFAPGSSVDQEGSVLVSRRTWEYFCHIVCCYSTEWVLLCISGWVLWTVKRFIVRFLITYLNYNYWPVKALRYVDSKLLENLDHYSLEYSYEVSVGFQSQLAHHRWLVSFTFGGRSPSSSEYKKLQAFLRTDHIQVPISYRSFYMSFCLSFFTLAQCLWVFFLRLAEWTVQQMQSCVSLSTSTNPV